MEHVKGVRDSCNESEEDVMELRRGPWTVDEDFTLMNYIAFHGEGRWNSLARCAGLKRTGKSCRLRWLNYLRPDVRRGNITLEEQLLILQLHCRWGNRWSKIAQHLPGRTDNEIKNYWRTRVQKHAKQLKCDVNSKQFKDAMRYLWMPRLMERIQAAAAPGGPAGGVSSTDAATTIDSCCTTATYNLDMSNMDRVGLGQEMLLAQAQAQAQSNMASIKSSARSNTPENSSTPAASSDSYGAQVSPVVSDLTDGYYNCPVNHQGNNQDYYHQPNQLSYGESLTSPTASYFSHGGLDFQPMDDQNNQWLNGAQVCDNLWNVEDMWFLHHQFNSNMFELKNKH